MQSTQKNNIARLIRERRLEKGYSQQELADLSQLNLRSVQRIENGEVLPRSSNLKRLANALGLDEELMLSGREEERITPVENKKLISLNRPRRVILTVITGLLLLLFTAAYLSLSMRFPETSFELFLFLAAICCFYTALIWRIWKNVN